MKKKILALLLAVTVTVSAVSAVLPGLSAASSPNLFENGDFTNVSGNVPTGWKVGTAAAFDIAIGAEKTPDGQKAITFTHKGNDGSAATFNSTKKIKIEKNHVYTVSFWAKVKDVKGLKFGMYEPDYIDRNGNAKHNEVIAEGHNVYSYNYDNGSTRVCRTNIKHEFKFDSTTVFNDSSSMLSVKGSTWLVLTKDYPSQNRPNEWVKVTHTFTTDGLASSEAEVCYGFSIPARNATGEKEIYAKGSTVTLGGFVFAAQQMETDSYAPTSNNVALGGVEPTSLSLKNGDTAKFTAVSVNGSCFLGWYKGEQLVTEEPELTFVWDSSVKNPGYQARFEQGSEAPLITDPSFEDTAKLNKVVANSTTVADPANGQHWVGDSNQYYSTWWNAAITNEKAHWGSQSVKLGAQWQTVGYRFTGLQPGRNYAVQFYTWQPQDAAYYLEYAKITAGSTALWIDKDPKGSERVQNPAAVILAALPKTAGTGSWQRHTLSFKNGSETTATLWLKYGTKDYMYLDDLSIEAEALNYLPTFNSSLGTVTPENGVALRPGEQATFAAMPNLGVLFDGWYSGDKLITNNTSLTFTYTGETPNYEARFVLPQETALQDSFEDLPAGKIISVGNTNHSPNRIVQNSHFRLSWQTITAVTKLKHSGNIGLENNNRYSDTGYRITGLKKNTEYAVGFWAYTEAGGSLGLNVTRQNEDLWLIEGDPDDQNAKRTRNSEAIMANSVVDVAPKTWTKVTIRVNSGNQNAVNLWCQYSPSGGADTSLYTDELAAYQSALVSVKSALGGSATASFTGEVTKGQKVLFKATPLVGNTFAGWYDANGKLVSTSAEYVYTANSNVSLTARFTGFNMPSQELFAAQGMDGSFENGSINGVYFDDLQDPSNWCNAFVTSLYAHSGTKSLGIFAAWRYTHIPLTGLTPGANYCLTYYLRADNNSTNVSITDQIITDPGIVNAATATNVYAKSAPIAINSGWNKVTMYFNSGSASELQLWMKYQSDDTNVSYYIDDIFLYEYTANEALQNGDFEKVLTSGNTTILDQWTGNGQITTENGSKALKLLDGTSANQLFKTKESTAYTVTFKAKGKLLAGVTDCQNTAITQQNAIASTAVVEVNSTAMQQYSFTFATSNQQCANLVFSALGGDAVIDNVTVTEKTGIGNNIEVIDFENSRYQLERDDTALGFQIYTGNEGDKNVHSGRSSLYYPAALSSSASYTNSSFLSLYAVKGTTYKVTFWYKITGGRSGGSVTISPDYNGEAGASIGYEQTADSTDWQKVSFGFNAPANGPYKFKIGGPLESDVYIDDITIEIAAPMVLNENVNTSFCEELYNYVENPSFESAATNSNWGSPLPKGFSIVSGSNALKGSHFMRLAAGSNHTFKFKVEPGKAYTFGISLRGSAGTKGQAALALMGSDGKYIHFSNLAGQTASVIQAKTNNEWVRSGFEVTPDDTGNIYLQLSCSAGTLDVESVMLFESTYALRYDANDYTIYKNYDYNNLKSATALYNGGYGTQPYFRLSDSASQLEKSLWAAYETPQTGESPVLLAVCVLSATVAFAAALLLILKRKGGAAND